MQVKQACNLYLQLVSITASLGQRLRRRVQKLVGQTTRELFEHLRRILAFGQQLKRVLQLVAARTFRSITQ